MIPFHRLLISTAVVFCAGFALWAGWSYRESGDGVTLVMAIASAAAAAALARAARALRAGGGGAVCSPGRRLPPPAPHRPRGRARAPHLPPAPPDALPSPITAAPFCLRHRKTTPAIKQRTAYADCGDVL